MRPMEQLTINELTDTWTLADIGLYGGFGVFCAGLGFYLAMKALRK